MAPDNPQTGSSTGRKGTAVSSDVDDAKRALDVASARNLKTRKPEGKETQQAGPDLAAATKVVDTVSNNDGVNLLFQGVNSLVDSLPPLVKALEAVAQIHPFVAIAVGAFKVVIELEIKRRDNDKKVNLLFLEMRNMMSVLLQLQSVRANHVARDGITIGARLVDLVKRTANDIKECANVCDTYSKKRLLVKVLKGPIWDDTLKGFIQLFVDRKAEFNFAVSIHTGMAIDRANDKLDALTARMELILKFFERSIPFSQRSLNALVEQAGGPDAALQSPNVLQKLIERESSFERIPDLAGDDRVPYFRAPARTPSAVGIAGSSRYRSHSGFDYSRAAESQRSRRRTRSHASTAESHRASAPRSYIPNSYASGLAPAYPGDQNPPLYGYRKSYIDDVQKSPHEQDIAMLKQELAQAPSAEISKNFETFERKFEIQTRELAEEMKRLIVHEGDRVISSVLAGPHERIIDPDLYEIWKDMRWRGIVKARHLVLAIHDYYLQKQEDQGQVFQVDGTQKRGSIYEDDSWTFEYIDLMHVQPIIEGLDDDASGFVTIQEVNQFTTSRPKGWSLLHWMAYWAVGWRVCMTAYRRKMLSTLEFMTSLLETVRVPNRVKLVEYLSLTRNVILDIVQPFHEDTEQLFVLPRFQAYMDHNEARLRKVLETVKYQIDALDTLALINGRKGLERNVFPLLHLVLSRHYDIMKLGRIHILHPDELIEAQESINIIQDAFKLRRNELSALFQQRRLSVSQEFDDFAFGMFSSASGYMPEVNARNSEGDETCSPDEELKPPSTGILQYPVHHEDFYPVNEDDVHDDEIGKDVDDSLKPILGRWSGTVDAVDGSIGMPLLNIYFHPASSSKNQVIAAPKLYFPWLCTRAIIVGECCSTSAGDSIFTFTTTFNSASCQTEYLRMTLSPDGKTLVGYQDIVPDCSSSGRFHVVMKKDIPLEVMAFYPSPQLLDTNRPKALWHFATSAILFQVQQRTITWRRIKAHRDKRRRYASLVYLQSTREQLQPADYEELQRLSNRSTLAEVHCCVYTAVEPEKFPWILPPCSGGTCGLLMKTAVPMLRCLFCPPELGYERFGAVFCGDTPDCLGDHLRAGLFGMHCIVKTRMVGWSAGDNEDERGRKASNLLSLVTATIGLLEGSRYGPPMEEHFSPHRLSPITEMSDEDQTEYGEPFLASVGTPNAVDNLSVSPVLKDAQHPDWQPESDLRSLAGEPTTPTHGSQLVDATFSPGSRSDTTVVEDGVMGEYPLLDSTEHSVQLVADRGRICIDCKEEVKMPCWLCTDCPGMFAPGDYNIGAFVSYYIHTLSGNIFVCLICDEKGGITAGNHEDTHTLVRIYVNQTGHASARKARHRQVSDYNDADEDYEDEENDDASESDWNNSRIEGAIESQLIALGGRLTRMEERFGTIESKLGRLEDMLGTVLSLLRAQPSTDNVRSTAS
ncbi:hypothetical protein GSI_03987 [Ganoderma sinense ZZ0214-1]|uniref:EF-hand domain-containing protein n=1 Tax=Ganoderma sinense ZZ0214-1 TaxID=1077348 RepID=A0A2G8SI20_9APHY|nr:hypothetical protein GSI_03987 [Ganoderma sinense ZZ0214-1]